MAAISDQLSHIMHGEQVFPFGDKNITIRYIKTSRGCMLGAVHDVAKAMAGPGQANISTTTSQKLASLKISYEDDLLEAIQQVVIKINYYF